MKKRVWLSFSFLLTLLGLLVSEHCKSQAGTIESATFGVYFGKCKKHCAPMFQYTFKDSILLADTTDSFFKQNKVNCTQVVGDKNKRFLAADIINHIPASLRGITKAVSNFGCPDCTDGGGIFLELKKDNGSSVRFLIDFQTDHLDGDVKTFADYLEMQMSKLCK
jgi:hypothetical protein